MQKIKIHKSGDSYVVTIPKEEMERQGLHEGDTVAFDARNVEHKIQLDPDVRSAFEASWETNKEDYDYLASN